MQVAGIDTYYQTTDQDFGHHIDFISQDCFNQTTKWNDTNGNNGTASEHCPYPASKIKSFLNTTIYNYLPQSVKNVIIDKRMTTEERYSSSGTIHESHSWQWKNIGKLWIPCEYEVFGSTVWGTKGWSASHSVQYPIFANSYLNRMKKNENGTKCPWWLATPGSATHRCAHVTQQGIAFVWDATTEMNFPICYRISEK